MAELRDARERSRPNTNASRMIRRLGVEEELLLVDPVSGVPMPASSRVLCAAGQERSSTEGHELPPTLPRLEREVKQEQVEVISPPCASLTELESHLRAGRRLADQAAQACGVRAVALGTSIVDVVSQLTDEPRFVTMAEHCGVTMHEQLTCGFHVHVEVESDDEGVAVLDRIRPWLPAVLALSANSPFWRERDTGFASYRYQVWTRWPSAGPYDIFGSASAYEETLRTLTSSGLLLDRAMVYFDARLCDRYPTVEVRVADVCMDPEEAIAIAGLIRALVDTAADEWRAGIPPSSVSTSLLRVAMWAASRFGLSRTLVDPIYGQPQDSEGVVEALLAHVESSLRRSGDWNRVSAVLRRIGSAGSGAERQRSALVRSAEPAHAVQEAINVTNER